MGNYGIRNISEEAIRFSYDKYYRNLALKLKRAKTENEKNEIKELERKKLPDLNNIEIDIEKLKKEFINLIFDDNSSQLLWILYSKYQDGENYIVK